MFTTPVSLLIGAAPVLSGFNPSALNSGALSNANLTFSFTGNPSTARSFVNKPGKMYFELNVDSAPGSGNGQFLICQASTSLTSGASNAANWGGTYKVWRNDGLTAVQGSTTGFIAGWTTGDKIGIGIDTATMSMSFYKNGVAQQTTTMAAGDYYCQICLFGGGAVSNTLTPTYLPAGYTAW